MSLTNKQIYDLNNMNRAAQNVSLGSILNSLIESGGGGTGDSVIVQKASYLEFPNIGTEKGLYIDSTTNTSYRWDNKEKKYYIIGINYDNIKYIIGGNANG